MHLESYTLQPAHIIRGLFILASICIIIVHSLPALRARFLSYGSRSTSPQRSDTDDGNNASAQPRHVDKDGRGELSDEKDCKERQVRATKSRLDVPSLLDKLATIRVPHAWFTHFYVLSVLSSIFWAHQIQTRGTAFRLVASTYRIGSTISVSPPDSAGLASGTTHRSASQVWLAWAMMLMQGLRRLGECLTLGKRSGATMWIGHYALGLGFYALFGVAIWIEGVPALLSDSEHGGQTDDHENPPPLDVIRSVLARIAFTVATAEQFAAHRHLASLKRYTLPQHPLFRFLLAPHYTAEIAIYASLAVFTAPPHSFVNWTVASAVLFVTVNLGVTAKGTKAWYEARFGRQAVKDRWVLLPGIW